MRYLSVCSGIEAVSVAWQPLGWHPAMFAEIDPFCCWLLRSRYLASRPLFMPSPHDAPDRREAKRRAAAIRNIVALPAAGAVINAGDFTRIGAADVGTIDLLAGGTPCQSFSVAGKRAGLDDPRGNLTIEFARLADRLRPLWVVWENVPGVLSIDGGRTFGAFLRMLVECGYGVAYRVLDAQHFGVPQRRRRVFVVGCFGSWRGAASVLLDQHSLSGHPPPRRKTGKGTAEEFAASSYGGYAEEGSGTLRSNGGDKLPAEIRTLSNFASILGPLGERLHRWTKDGTQGAGQFGHLFDNPQDTLTFSRFQTFNFDGWSDYPDLLEPLLFYVLQRASSEIEKPQNTATFKLFVIDEAWIFLKNATIRDWILKAEKTWRKKNAAMLLATQSVVELAASDMLHIVNESCPTKIFLANPNIDRKMYAEIFQLNDTQLELLESLVPKRELLLIQPRGTKKLVLEVDALGYWMATNNARDNLRKQDYFARFGPEQGLIRLAHDYPTPLDDFRAQIETNLFGVIIMTKAVLPYFRERKAGHIIQVTSIAGRLGPIGRAPYATAKFGVEGFSESLAKEIGPLGVKVTIVEPGGFRTDFAGSSTELRQGRPEYESTVGATIRFQRDYNGKQPGDPAKAAAVLLHVASLPEPPLRLLLGSDSYNAAEKSALDKLESDRKWKDLSVSTDYSS